MIERMQVERKGQKSYVIFLQEKKNLVCSFLFVRLLLVGDKNKFIHFAKSTKKKKRKQTNLKNRTIFSALCVCLLSSKLIKAPQLRQKFNALFAYFILCEPEL